MLCGYCREWCAGTGSWLQMPGQDETRRGWASRVEPLLHGVRGRLARLALENIFQEAKTAVRRINGYRCNNRIVIDKYMHNVGLLSVVIYVQLISVHRDD